MNTKNLQKVKYLVTGDFGEDVIGSVINVFLVQKDSDQNVALLYAPTSKGLCASYMICKKNDDDYWVSQTETNWVNC